MSPKSTMSRWVERLQERGRYTFTRAQVESETGRSLVAAQTALRRLKEQGRVVAPRRGFYVVVPPEYRAAGSPPATWFIDELMHHLGQPYYVGLLTAAALHGAGHQRPMVFQVVTSKPTREMRSGEVALQFTMRSGVKQMPVLQQQTETGTMRLATAETTAFDLVRYPAGAGHLSNAATVLGELSERMNGHALMGIAPLVRLPDVQRLGFLVEAVGERGLAEALARWLEGKRPRAIALDPRGPAGATADRQWRVRENVELELDL